MTIDTLAIVTDIDDTLNMDTAVNHNVNSVFNCHYHVVFCPKYRRKVLVNGIDERLKQLILETVQKWGQEIISVEVMPDHVHLLVSCDPHFGIHASSSLSREPHRVTCVKSSLVSKLSYRLCGPIPITVEPLGA